MLVFTIRGKEGRVPRLIDNWISSIEGKEPENNPYSIVGPYAGAHRLRWRETFGLFYWGGTRLLEKKGHTSMHTGIIGKPDHRL